MPGKHHMADDDLASINLTSGVNEKGDGFVSVACHTAGGRIILGQLDPATVRRMAMDWLESAEAAEQDAAVLRCIRKLELPDQLAAMVVTELRNTRENP